MTEFLITFAAKYLVYLSGLAFPYLWWKRERHNLIRIIVTVILAYALSEAIKAIFYLPRPFVAEGFIPLFPHEADGSFPSSHAVILSALGGSIFFGERKVGIALVVLAAIVGTARVLAGIHYPLDIIGGIVLGLGVAFLVKFLHEKFPYW